MKEIAIRVENLSKCFKIFEKPIYRLAEWGSLGKIKKHHDFWALSDISFEVERGGCLGVIGPNGAGKSTLLKILTRTLYPTSGDFFISGNVLSLLELGTGLNYELTGRQNVYYCTQLLGLPGDHLDKQIGEIEEFADIGEFFDRPIKIYSSGMLIRLAFSMFVCMKPHILIIDETLSVGDVFFQQKSRSQSF